MNALRALLLPVPLSIVLAVAGCSSASSGGVTGTTPTGGSSDGGGGKTGTDAGPTSDGGPGKVGGDAAATLAPLDWTFDGTPTTWSGVSFDAPKGWTAKTTTTDFALTAPASDGTCVIDVLAPRAAATGAAAQRTQLWDLVTAGFMGHTLTDTSGNATPTEGLTSGTGAQGYTFVGYRLQIDQDKLESHAYLAVFGATAVPFMTLYDPLKGGCLTSVAGEVNEAQLLHTLTLAGQSKPVSLAASVVGDFSLGTTGAQELYTIGADGSFIFTLVTDFNGSMTTSQTEGTYALSGNVMSFFPSKGAAAYSDYVRVYQSTDTSVTGGILTYLCLLGAGDPKTTGSEACFYK